MRYEFHVEARTEFLEVITRYQSEVHGLGERFVTEVDRCIGVLLENPRIGALFGSKLRSFPLNDGFPFSLVYSVRTEMLFIVAVAHQSRKPGYWKHRISRK